MFLQKRFKNDICSLHIIELLGNCCGIRMKHFHMAVDYFPSIAHPVLCFPLCNVGKLLKFKMEHTYTIKYLQMQAWMLRECMCMHLVT